MISSLKKDYIRRFRFVLVSQDSGLFIKGISKKDPLKPNSETKFYINYTDDLDSIAQELQELQEELNTKYLAIMNNRHPNLHTFNQDPALKTLSEISLPKVFPDQFQNTELRIQVARNLYFQDKKPTTENISTEIENILKTRREYKNVPLFKDRHVLFLANNEKYKNGQDRFNKKLLKDKLQKQAKDFVSFTPTKDTAYIEVMRTINDQILSSPDPLTFVFEGHGLNNSISLTAQNEINYSFLAESIFRRYQKYPQLRHVDPDKRDIYIFDSCFGHDYIRNMYDFLKKQNTKTHYTLPILISAAEYGQYSWSNPFSEYDSEFFKKIFSTSQGRFITFGDLINSQKNAVSN